MNRHAACRHSPRLTQAQGLARLREFGGLIALPEGETLGVQGEPCGHVYVILSGQILQKLASGSGAARVTYILGPGDLLGEGALHVEGRWLLSTRTVTAVRACTLTRSQVLAMAGADPALLSWILSLLTRRLELAHTRLQGWTQGPPRDRMLQLLRQIATGHPTPDDGEVWLPMLLTQTELGEVVGLARETVSRTLASMEAEGLIRRRTRRGLWLAASALDTAA